jgi:hypothetical protein
MVIETQGILEFSPPHKTKKHEKQGEWKSHALIFTNCDLEKYYRWFLETRFNLELSKTLRGSHVTIISDRLNKEQQVRFDNARQIWDKHKITFYYELEPLSSGSHWWLRTHCPLAEIIREAIGLSPTPFFSFHLTIGRADLHMDKDRHGKEFINPESQRRKEHSEYILKCCKEFNLISYEERKPFYEHEIIKFYEKA